MVFNSFPFLLFLAAVVALHELAASSATRRKLVLLAASWFFYAYVDVSLILLLFLSLGINYAALNLLARMRAGWAIIVPIAINLALLGYFKYAGFLTEIVNSLASTSFEMHVLLPLGISFFTFEQISMLVDYRQGKIARPRPLDYALFISFFPHLVAGPIVRAAEFLPQLATPEALRPLAARMATGMPLFIWGLTQKVLIADRLSPHVAKIFDVEPELLQGYGSADVMGGILAYTLQIFFDFSGYSLMALGLAALFGLKLPVNFNAPYLATSITEFWRRWHMTLSRFLRDYLYIPLGGNRKGARRRYINLIVTMFLGGLWHGANWTFVIWGLLHGCYLAVNHGWNAVFPAKNAGLLHRVGAWALTFHAVMLAWVFFRAADIETALIILERWVSFAPAGEHALSGKAWRDIAVAGAVCWLFPNPLHLFAHDDAVMEVERPFLHNPRLDKVRHALRGTWGGVAFALLLFGVLHQLSEPTEFLYWQF